MRKSHTALILLILLSLLSTPLIAGEDNLFEDREEGFEVLDFYHTVEPGDTLYKLAQRYETTIEKISEANGLESSIIQSGQRLSIPEEKSESEGTYVVQPGDSLYKIALRFNTTVSRLQELNELEENVIFTGQELKVPNISADSADISGKITFDGKSRDIVSAGDTVSSLNSGENEKFQQGEVIVKYKPVISPQDREEHAEIYKMEAAETMSADNGQYVRYSLNEDKDMEELIKELEEQEQVEWVEPNYIYYPTAVPSDPNYDRQWNLDSMNMEDAWDVEKGSDSVVVAVLDTGVITDHPDLQENLLNGADFVGGRNDSPVSSYEKTDEDPSDETTLGEGGSHGTHVAGIIGAVTDNARGVAGVSWDVNILPVRVLERTGGTSWDIIEGIYYAIDQGADVINMSLGGTGNSRLNEEAVNRAVKEGVTVIAATGNDGTDSVYYPAAYENVIAVGAVGRNDQLTYYSNYGPEVDVVAPGGDYSGSIYSTWGYYDPNNDNYVSSYGAMRGTSMATPHVSGLAALLSAAGIEEPEEIGERLVETAVDLGGNGRDDRYGHGLVDARAALQGEKSDTPGDPVVFAGKTEKDKLEVKSEFVEPGADRKFTIQEVPSGSLQVYGWVDENNNGAVDQGDYFGKSETLNVAGEDITNIEFVLEKQAEGDTNLEVEESAD